jgi:BCD family chlorophyll transporter-like MFS transporter
MLSGRWTTWRDAHPVLLAWVRLLRLGLFQLGLGLSLAPLTGTLNRVLVAELAIPAGIVALLLSVHFFVSPIRALIGFHSDRKRSAGRWRTPYVVLGAMMTYGGLALAPFALILLAPNPRVPFPIAVAICLAIFILYGVGVNIVETMFLALVSDITPRSEQGRTLAVLWMMLVAGTIIGAFVVGQLLDNYTPFRLIQVLQGTAVTFIVTTFLALFNQERMRRDGTVITPNYSGTVRLTLPESLRQLAGMPQLRNLMLLLFIATGAFATHDVLLEPYGAQVLGMSVRATTELTIFWGMAMLVAVALAGWSLRRNFPPLRLIAAGCAAGMLGFLVVSLGGGAQSVVVFQSGVTLIGFGRGLFVVGSLALVLGLTQYANAGFLIGLWGVVQAVAQGIGVIFGGVSRDTMNQFSSGPLLGYVLVYAVSCAALIVALVVLMLHHRELADVGSANPWGALADIPADQLMS